MNLLLAQWFFLHISAQDQSSELRTTYTHQHFISKYRFWIRNDIGFRQFFEEDPYTMMSLRPRVILELTGILDLHPGIDFRFSHYPSLPNTLEIRTWQGLSLHWPDVGRIYFTHFYRFEQRFYWTEGSKEEDLGLRSRYRLQMRVPLNNRILSDKTFYTDIRGEIFIPHDDEIQEIFASQLRVGLNLGYQQNRKWRYQITGYIDAGRNTLEENIRATNYIIELSVRNMF